jgi:hypothetical protein
LTSTVLSEAGLLLPGPVEEARVKKYIDIVKGFSACMKASQKHQSMENVFVKCFGVPFWSSTFYRHRRKWEGASEACRDDALRVGRTSAGLWSAFVQSSERNVVDVRRKKTKKVRVGA